MAAPYYLRFRAIALTLRAGLRGAPPAVRAASEASRHFLTGAATPPLGGGEYPPEPLWLRRSRAKPFVPFVAASFLLLFGHERDLHEVVHVEVGLCRLLN